MEERYLVIGGAGLVGSHLIRTLRGRDVVTTYHHAQVPRGLKLDVLNQTAVQELIRTTRPDIVVLAAAEPFVERCEREPDATRAVNVGGAQFVAEAVREAGATLVVFSSEYVFDGTGGEYAEGDQIGPINEYGRQKAQVEEIARAVPSHLICRTSGVFGIEDERKNFVLQLVDALRAGRTFTVPSDQVITPTDAVSLARSVVELLEAGQRGTFHLAGPERMLRPVFASKVADAFGLDRGALRSTPTADLGLAAARPLRAGLRDDKLRSVLGHGLESVDDALRELAALSP